MTTAIYFPKVLRRMFSRLLCFNRTYEHVLKTVLKNLYLGNLIAIYLPLLFKLTFFFLSPVADRRIHPGDGLLKEAGITCMSNRNA